MLHRVALLRPAASAAAAPRRLLTLRSFCSAGKSNGGGPVVGQDIPEYVSARSIQGTYFVEMRRPESNNAFDEEFIAQLHDAFDDLDVRAHRCVVLSGQGRNFSAGADLNYMKRIGGFSQEQNFDDSLALFDMIHAIRSCPLPVIGRIQGAAMGGGAGLVAACDMAFAWEKTMFGFTEVKLGLVPAVISPFVVDKIGTSAASRYFLTGENFDAREALRIGLVHGVAESMEDLDAMIMHQISLIHRNSPNAVQHAKGLLGKLQQFQGERESIILPEESPEVVRSYTAGLIAELRSSEEGREGVQAFLEKRAPGWVGRPRQRAPAAAGEDAEAEQ